MRHPVGTVENLRRFGSRVCRLLRIRPIAGPGDIWDAAKKPIRWLMQYQGRRLAETVCKEKLVGANLLTADDEAALSLIRGRQRENVCER